MIDITTRNPLYVSTDGDAGPYIMLPLAQLERVRALLQRFRPGDHGYVDEQVVASGVRGDEPEPAVAVVTCDDAVARACGHAR